MVPKRIVFCPLADMLTRSQFAIKDYYGFPFPYFIKQKCLEKQDVLHAGRIQEYKTCDGSKLLAGLIFHFYCLEFNRLFDKQILPSGKMLSA